jgi:hypothetical protein
VGSWVLINETWYNCVHVDISSRTRIGSARFGSAQAIIRCGEPVQLQLSEGFFASNRAEQPVVGQGHGRFTNGVMME